MIKAKAYAKLNLNLHVLPDQEYKQKTGYYPIRFINCNLELHDELYFEEQKRTIDFTCDDRLKKENLGKIGTIVGRAYAMDRNNKWNFTQKTYSG